MDDFIKNRLENMERCAEQIKCNIYEIIGYCDGMETVARMEALKEDKNIENKQEV